MHLTCKPTIISLSVPKGLLHCENNQIWNDIIMYCVIFFMINDVTILAMLFFFPSNIADNLSVCVFWCV